MDYFDQINNHKYIYLSAINEPEDNSLSFIVEEALAVGAAEEIEVSGVNLPPSRSIEVTSKSKKYKVYFDSYIAYSVLDESYALPDDLEKFSGRLFCIYQKSNFLDYTSKASFACDDHPGPSKHYGFNCLNHVINIVSTIEPKIEIIYGT